MENDNKQIFEPGDFSDVIGYGGLQRLDELFAERCNRKLSSLGIDAETPEKIARLEACLASWKREEANWIGQELELKKRLAKIEAECTRIKQAYENAELRWLERDRVKGERLAELETKLKNREWYIDKIEPRLKELERMIAEAEKRHEETLQMWNKQIAEAPVVYLEPLHGDCWYCWESKSETATRSGRLVLIEELK